MMKRRQRILWLVSIAVVLCSMACRKGSKDVNAIRDAKMARSLALEAHRGGDINTAKREYEKAEKLLRAVAQGDSPYKSQAQELLDACSLDKGALFSPTGVTTAIFGYLPKSDSADWDLFIDFNEVSKRIAGEDRWDQLSEEERRRLAFLFSDVGLSAWSQEISRVGGIENRFSNEKIEGEEASVQVTSSLKGVEVDSVVRLVKVGPFWKFFDAYNYTLEQGFCKSLGKGLDLACKDMSLSEFLAQENPAEEFIRCWGQSNQSLVTVLDESLQGKVVTVVASTGIFSGSDLLGTIQKGTHFKVIQERRMNDGVWLLGRFEMEGGETTGWVEKNKVKPLDERAEK